MIRRILYALIAVVASTLGVMVNRAIRTVPHDEPVTRATFAVDTEGATQRLQGAIRFPTVSNQDGSVDRNAFMGLHQFLAQAYPLTHKTLTREVVNEFSLLYRWPGKDPKKPPIVLMGHIDVVPIAPGTENAWSHPPFAATIDGDWLYGRGTLDDKSTVIAALEAIEHLLKEGFQPERTIILQFGHDEEVGGRAGAKVIADKLAAEGVTPALVLDEGGALTAASILGGEGLAGMVGVAEKGFVSLELSVAGDGGHSSTPPNVTHIGRIARAVARLEANPLPASLDGPARSMLEAAAPYVRFSRRLALANLWLTKPLVTRALLGDRTTAATVRTTTAPTIFQAGNKDNVLPPTARAVVNFRIRPGETVASVTEAATRIVNDGGVKIQSLGFSTDPSPSSDPNLPAYAALKRAIRETLGDAPPTVLPFLMMGATDARYWAPRTGAAYRFNPFPMEQDAMKRAHGTDERLSVKGFVNGVRFYVQLIKNAQTI